MEVITYEGVVRRINHIKGCGFLYCDELGEELYFGLKEGEHIMFDSNRNEIIGVTDKEPKVQPEPGDMILFQIKAFPDGRTRARPWGLKREYDRAKGVRASLP